MQVQDNYLEHKRLETGLALNEAQRQAVEHTEGPLLLLASPGSGKTTTIMMRIGYLIEMKGIQPSRIKAVTFSRASASDMKERFKRLFPRLQPVDFSTIHSLAFEMMREHFRRTGTAYRIIEGEVHLEEVPRPEDEATWMLHKKILLRNLFKSATGEHITDDQMDELTTYISYIKNKMLPVEKWSTVKTNVPQAEHILQEYERVKRTSHVGRLIDYDDMLVIGHEALETDPQLLRKYQNRYDYVLTDESQDTSLIQHAILEKLVQRHGNLCVVADDDQSLYSWRGAEPAYLLNFKQTYPSALTLFMEHNYRSSKEIVETANQFIQRNLNRYPKQMFTHNQAERPIQFKSLADYKEQAKYLVRQMKQVNDLGEVAVLYRNNSSAIALMNEFDREGIPFYMKDADNRFFSHWVVEDILNFMRMTFTDKRADILEKIHLKLGGYISKQQMAALKEIHNGESVFDNLITHVPLQDYQIKPLRDGKETFQQMRGMPPLQAIRVIRTRLGYEKALEKSCERMGFRKESLLGILNTLEDIAAGLDTMEDFASRLQYLKALLKTARFRKGQSVVTFSTMHSSKGLEFDRVYMIDLVNGIIPSTEDAASVELMEEATRLFYVGMTRARSHLELISYRARDGEEAVESTFVAAVKDIVYPDKKRREQGDKPVQQTQVSAPLNPNAIRSQAGLVEGGAVKHNTYGIGTIIQVNEQRVHVRFASGEKALSTSICLDKGLLEPASQN
ncbi:ATP-dependent helicase [Paenibacillus sanguinis]|uniref:ATP-dependent helicase n=1 Tax=Paenibacillus sanguinis TaxID=225906 RepID=UPI0003628052|nr:ATP-dependent helicase [Paenibacillus sanguinis]